MFKSFKIRTSRPINLQKHNKQNLKHAKQEIMMKKITKLKEKKNQKHDRINDITYQKCIDVLQSLQKIKLCRYQQKMKNPNTYSTCIRKKRKNK